MLGATLAGVVGLPLLVPAAVIFDLARLRWRLPTVRVYLFLVQYGINDSFEILAAPFLWLWAGFGTRLGEEPSTRRHERIQRWSVDVLARRAERLLGVRLRLEAGSDEALAGGPVIVLCRHVNLLDASLPSLLYQRLGFRVRGVIMAELLADPGFDLLYSRLGSVFIPRDNAPEALTAIAALGEAASGDTALVIYPEGRLFRPDALERAKARLEGSDPERAERLAGLGHVLPPRPAGTLALLHAVPVADVVVIGHVGLDRFASFTELARSVPLREPLQVSVRRIRRADVPAASEAQVRWLDDVWLDLDRWVETHR